MKKVRTRKFGKGFRADCEYLRLFVEVEHNGWTVGIYDLKKNAWVTQGEKVRDDGHGKARATEIAAFVLDDKNIQPKWTTL
jgi:hypothetical protein